MFRCANASRRLIGLLALLALAGSWAGAETPDQVFYRAYYLEVSDGDLAGAAELYTKVVDSRDANSELKRSAQVRLEGCREELACSDFAALMPPNALAYVELRQPGEQVLRLLGQLGLTIDENGTAPPEETRFAIHPALIRELLGIKGAALAVTSFNPMKQQPSGVVVFHPGNMEVIRGILETGMPIGGKPSKPIASFATYKVEGDYYVTFTRRLVIASAERSEIADVIKRLRGESKKSLATSDELGDTLANRDDALLYFCVHAKPIMPIVNGMLALGGTQNRELGIARALLDPNSLRTISGTIGINDDGLFANMAVRLDSGHHNLVYNLLRLPPIDPQTLKTVPAGVAGFFAMSLSDADAVYQAAPPDDGENTPVITGLDLLREVFANIIGVSVFVLPPAGETASAGMPVPDVAAIITVHDPSKSDALWSQLLGVASLASGGGALEGTANEIEGQTVRQYKFPNGVSVYFTKADNTLLIAGTESALSRTLAAHARGESVLTDTAFKAGVGRIGPDSTFAFFAHPARCAQVATRFAPPGAMDAAEPVIRAMTNTVASLVVDHSGQLWQLSLRVTGMPEVGPLVTQYMMQQREAGAAAAAAAREIAVLRSQMQQAKQNGDWEAAAEQAERALARRPSDANLLEAKFRVLAARPGDTSAAREFGNEILKRASDDAEFLNDFAWCLLTEEEYGGRFAELALRLSERSNELTEHSIWAYVDTLALAKFETGDVAAAVELERKALELCSDSSNRRTVERALQRFEAALAGREPENKAGGEL